MKVSSPVLVLGAREWLPIVAALAGVLLLLLLWGYWRASASPRLRLLAASLKLLGIIILACCLLEPLLAGNRAKPGANQFVVLVDNSASMTLRDRDSRQTRGQQLKSLATKPSAWLSRLAADFDLRQYAFDTQLRAVPDLDVLAFDGGASNLGSALDRVTRRYQGRPLAGILLLSDGNATDPDSVERLLSSQPAQHAVPIYPVYLGRDNPAADIDLEKIAVTQTNFEDAPVTLAAQISATGFKAGQSVVAELFDEGGKSVEQQKLSVEQDGTPMVARFRVRPEHAGVSFYRVAVSLPGQKAAATTNPSAETNTPEATLANNSRLVAVDRGQGPYRVLYLGGRPDWEFKFLRRAIESDDQVQLVGLIRVAKREPKFTYLGHHNESFNPLFRGFNNTNDDTQQYDQPVLVRLNTADENELRSGFPKVPEDLYRYDALIVDDLEGEFFTQDQMLLVKEFVRQRGGGLLMLGGQESFKNGKFDRTPIGDLLPVYLDAVPELPLDARWRMTLSREGWLEPWLRLRSEEDAERKRLEAMPDFNIVNPVRAIKPGATILARAETDGGATSPALVEQRFGRGRAAALLIGDLWRWDLGRPENSASELEKAWRQVVRWLVSDVPHRVELSIEPANRADDPEGVLRVGVRVRDPAYKPMDNASVNVQVTGPDEKPATLRAEASDREAGLYEALYVPRQSGAYRAQASVADADGADVGKMQAGWTSDPAAEEFRQLKPNRTLLDRIAKSTGGQSVAADELESFVATLPTRHAEITEPFIRPFWHQAWIMLLAMVCLTAEWGLRRWRGLP